MPVTFVGDVHGWSDRLDRVLDQAEGLVVLMGDLIDRGPDSSGVLRRVRRLCDAGRAQCLLGNHEYAMLCGLGVPDLGIEEDAGMFAAWRRNFGGQAVLTDFGADDADGLRSALGDDLAWLSRRPWVLQGDSEDRHWVAVHAGLGEDPIGPQLELLATGWAGDDGMPSHLFNKAWAHCLPVDLPRDWCVVSGHTPVRRPLVAPQRVLCDTSGGMPDRVLSGVIWPAGRVITS
jgi:hypothetical protein